MLLVIVLKATIMRTINYAAILGLVMAFSVSCRKHGTWGVRGQGSNETEARVISGFNGINLKTDAEVNYVFDSVYKVEVDAQRNILAILSTEIEGGDLVIDVKRCVTRANRITVTVHSPHMNRLIVSGSGNINSKGTINENDLLLSISGSGNISVPNLNVQALNTRISGSGCVKVDIGTVANANHIISGSGHVGAEYVTSNSVDAKISGSGNLTIKVESKLNVNISGSGSVKYHGQPSVTANVSGSGRLIALD